MKQQRNKIFLLVLVGLLLVSVAAALPPLPTEFYGAVYLAGGTPATTGTVITLHNSGGTQCGPGFTVSNPGYFGLLTCPGDDPETVGSEGFSDGQVLTVYVNGVPAQYLDGDNVTDGGDFHFLNISYPVPSCGDDICDPFFETVLSCPLDCDAGNGTGGNGTGGNETEGNETGGNETGGNETGGGETGETDSSSSSGGGSGGGGSGGGGSSFQSFLDVTVLDQIISLLPQSFESPTGGQLPCTEDWYCEDWEACTIDGLQFRECIDERSCGTSEYKPVTIQECEYVASCYNGIQDFAETGLDCGGPCQPCASCTNNIQDCHTLENGTILCETGIDCGGACRSCNSCFNGVRDFTESGVDCGGEYCDACVYRPALEFPALVCSKNINPATNGGGLFFLFLFLFLAVRVYFYLKKIDYLHRTHELDDYKRARDYYAERRKMVLFVLVAVSVAVLAYVYYYEFLLCSLEYSYLWWFALLLVLVPMLVYEVWRFMEYHDKKKLVKLGSLVREHADAMDKMLGMENRQIVEIEKEIKEIIERISQDRVLHGELLRFNEMRVIYKDIIRLFYEYETNKTPYGIEKELCDQVYALETNDQFQHLAGKYPDFWMLFERLKLLYQHYEGKQALYDQIQQEKDRLKKHVETGEVEVKEEGEESEEKLGEKK